MSTLAERDKRYLWHPFTQMSDWMAADPMAIEAAQGNYLIDDRGRRYLDGVSSLWCNVHGHRHPTIDEAVRQQLDKVAHSTMLGLTHAPAVDLAERLVGIMPGKLARVFYSDAGATAVEIALKLAFQYQGLRGETARTRFVSFEEAYHGDTLGAVSVGFSETFHRFYSPLLFECERIPPPHLLRIQERLDPEEAEERALAQARELFDRIGQEIAAVIVEPLVQGAAGMWMHSTRFLAEVARMAKAAGTLLICDEVATGFGRTGKMFASELAGVDPDILCVGKGITGGYLPLAATMATEEVFEAFLGRHEDLKAFFHGHTYTGNPLGCAAALATLDVFEQERTMERVASRMSEMETLLAAEVAPLEHVGDVRRRGLMVGIELFADAGAWKSYAGAERMGHRVCMAARERDVIIRPLGDVVILMPPLSIQEDELAHLVRATAESIREVTGG